MFRFSCLSRMHSSLSTISPVKERCTIDFSQYFTRNVRYIDGVFTNRSLSASTAPTLIQNEKIMLILGKPGGGKGTISSKILQDFPQIEHISTGDILRKHVREETELGKEAKKYMDSGDLVPDEVMIRLVLESYKESRGTGKCLLLDGFPRTIEQAISLDENIDVEAVVDLDIPTETIVERIADRWIHHASGRVYNYSYNPPLNHGKDNETGEDLIQRDDDQPSTVRKRLLKYNKVTKPLIQYYKEKGVLKTFKGTMSDKIYPDVREWLKEIGLLKEKK